MGYKKTCRLRDLLHAAEKQIITDALATHGTQGRAAEALGVSRITINAKVQKYGLQNVAQDARNAARQPS